MASYTKILAQLTFITITIDSHWASHLRTKQIMSKWWNIGYSWTEVAGEVKSTLQTSKQIKARRTKITTLMPFVCCLFDILVIFRSLYFFLACSPLPWMTTFHTIPYCLSLCLCFLPSKCLSIWPSCVYFAVSICPSMSLSDNCLPVSLFLTALK